MAGTLPAAGEARGAPARLPLPPHPPLWPYYLGEPEHRRRIDEWFDQAARDYDWITQVMSFGCGHWYRRRALPRAGAAGRVAAPAPSLGMLRQASGRGVRLRVRGLADTLPFADERFDLLAMGYA